MVARQLGAATRFPGWLSYKAYGHGRAMLAPTGVFRQTTYYNIIPFLRRFRNKKEERSASLAVKLLVVVTVELGLTDGLDFFLDVKALFQCGVNGHQAQQAGQPQAG